VDLKEELQLAKYTGLSDQECLDSLEDEVIPFNKKSLTNTEVLEAIDPTELAGLTDKNSVLVGWVLGISSINPFGVAATIFIDAFGLNSQTITNLKVLRKTLISRVQELGIRVGLGLIQEARR